MVDLVAYDKADGIAVITLTATEGDFPWGTARAEHRWNPPTVTALAEALDRAAADEACSCVVVTGRGKFWSNGMDLRYMDAHNKTDVKALGVMVDSLMAKILCFPIPTIAAINGHFCAAGGMMGLCFDYRIMNAERGFFFVPGVDLGIVYSPFQTAMMCAKLPTSMHQDVIVQNRRRWSGADLLEKGVVVQTAPAAGLLGVAMEFAAGLKAKGQGPARAAMGPIKKLVFRQALGELEGDKGMGYGG
eukprot:CAMPEP_0168399686 /NCGR_PEP_ID=MMETSP0228-20121227/22214_1 /TAXON_ID=133427 /ORGANISM="Protoceratium reticulatum, Strain CCCM 535 (=CCMP 1889)" /LENGTH=245 /DNA_ID=CAMNT_0008413211 /DNA_START=47 /DNA_END=780 /DNA_ORIENTATION=+